METRDKILETARRLMQTRGYNGFSFQDIADNIGVRKPSLYHHFKSKDAVAIEVLRAAVEQFSSDLGKSADMPARDRLEKYFAALRVMQGAGERMCPGCSFAGQLDAVSPAVQDEVQKFTKFHLDWLEQTLRFGREQGAFGILHRAASKTSQSQS